MRRNVIYLHRKISHKYSQIYHIFPYFLDVAHPLLKTNNSVLEIIFILVSAANILKSISFMTIVFNNYVCLSVKYTYYQNLRVKSTTRTCKQRK